MTTERLHIRPTQEQDRDAFVELFCDEDFMVFSGGALSRDQATERFDLMLQHSGELTFAKQPLFAKGSGTILGYAGVRPFRFEGEDRLEFGWRLVPAARGRGYATEASSYILNMAAETWSGEILAMIDPRNEASKRVAAKLGFQYWKDAVVDGYLDGIYRYQVG